MSDPVTDDPYAAALLRERKGYVARGLTERVAAVDAELRRVGVVPPDESGPPKTEQAEQAAPPRRRRAPGKSAT
jgi:hypothetical protein